MSTLMGVSLGLMVEPSTQAATYLWSGATNGNMSGTPANWGGTVPTGTDIAEWNAASYTSAPTANAAMSIGQLWFAAGNTAGVTFGSGTNLLTLNGVSGTGIQIDSGSGAVNTGSAKFALAANQNWTNNSANLLTVGGTITNTANVTPFTLTLNGSGTGGTTLSGIISNGGTTGTTALIINTTGGATTLSGANTFTGGVNLTTGTLNINNATALGGAAGTFSISSGTTINNSTGAAVTMTQNNAQTWNGNFTFTGTQALTFGTGAVTMAANTTVTTSASTLTEGGAIGGGSFTLTKAGNGTLVLNGANTYNGLTTVSAGTLTLAGNNTGSGGVTLTAGTLNINNAGALGLGTLTITAGTINNSTATDITTSTNNNLQNWNGSFSYTGTKALNLGTGAVTLGASPTVTVNGTGLNGAGALTVGGAISGTGRSLTKAGTGTLILSGTNSYDGGTTVNGGVLQFNSAAAIAGSGNNVTVNAVNNTLGATVAFGYAFDTTTLTSRLAFADSKGTVALAADNGNNLDFTAAGLTKLSLGASTGTWTYSGALWTPADGIYRLGGGGGTLTFNPTLASGSLLVGGGNSGGTVTLANARTSSGATTVTGGLGSSTVGTTGGPSLLQTNILTGTSNTPFGSNGSAIILNNGALGLGTAGTLASGNVVNVTGYNVTYNGQNSINLTAGSGNVTFAANTLTRSNHGVLLLAPTSGVTLGGTTGTEKVTVTSGAPVVTNGMVSPYYIDGTTRNFLTYDATNGFKDVTYTITGTGPGVLSSALATDTVSITGSNLNTAMGGNKAIYALKLSNNSVNNANAFGANGETLSILSGGLILDMPNAGGGFNFNSSGTFATFNFGTAEAMIGVFGSGGTAQLANNAPFIGTGGLTLYGNGTASGYNILITGGVTIAGGKFSAGSTNGINTNNQLTIGKAGTLQFAGQSQQFLGLSGEGLINASSGSGTLTLDGLTGTGTTTFSGLIQNGSGNVALTKSGLNTQVLTGANTYTGVTTISGGTLRLDFSAADAPTSNIINGSALALGGGKLDIVGAAGVTNSQQLSGLTMNAGNSSIAVSSGTGGSANVTLGSTLTRNVGGTVNFVTPASGALSTAATTTLTNGVLSTSASNPTAFATVNGTDWATVSGGVIGAAASYTTGNANYTTTNNVDVTDGDSVTGVTVNSLRFNSAATGLTLSGTNTVNTGGILVTSAATGASITGGILKSNTGNELVIINNGQLTVNSVIAPGAGTSALTLSGSGTTTLNGSNTFTGSTYINSGTVVVGNANAFGTGGTVSLNGGALQSSSALTISRAISLSKNSTIGGSNDLTLSGTFTNTSSANTLTVNNTAATTLGAVVLTGTLNVAGSGNLATSGVISSTGGLTYAGTGTMTLSGAASTYTGVTKVSSGTLSVSTLAAGGAASGIGQATNAAANIVLDGGTLKYTGATVSTDRLFSVGGSGGTLDASGSGAVTFSNAGALGFANTPGTRTLTLAGTNTGANTLNAVIGNHLGLYATSLNKTDAGKWVLGGLNTYTGGTTVNAGTLVFGNSFTMSGANAMSVAATGTAGVNYATVSNTVGTLTFGGTLGINISASLTGGESFTLFSANGGVLAGDFGSTTGNVSVTGSYVASLTNNGSGIWTGTDTNGSGLNFTFATSGVNAGMLSVSAIPEPATCAAVFGVLALAGATWQRRRATRR